MSKLLRRILAVCTVDKEGKGKRLGIFTIRVRFFKIFPENGRKDKPGEKQRNRAKYSENAPMQQNFGERLQGIYTARERDFSLQSRHHQVK